MNGLKRGLDEFQEERRGRNKGLTWGFILAVLTMLLAAAFLAHRANGQELDTDQLVLTSAFITGANFIPADVAETEEPFVTLSGGVGAWSQYLGETGGVFHDAPVLQGNITAEFRSGLYVDLWASRAEGPWLSSWGDEIDFTIGFSPNEHFDIGIAYLLACDLAPSDVGWAFVMFATPSLSDQSWSLSGYTRADYYWPLSSAEDVEGYNFRVGSELSQEGEQWSAKQVAEVIYDTGAFGAGEGYLWMVMLEVARNVGGASVGVGVKYSRGINLPEWDDRTGEYAFGTFVRF